MTLTRTLADFAAGGAAVPALSNVGDVALTALADKDLLVRDQATGKWENRAFDDSLLPSIVSKTVDPTLFNIRKRLRAGPDVLDYGVVNSATADNADALEAAFAAVRADGYSELFLPAGNYRLHRQIQMNHGVRLKGEHKSSSVLKFYHSGTGLVATGSAENGGGLENISIINDSGAPATAYVQLVAASGGTAPDFFNIIDCNFSSFQKQSVQYGIVVNGNARDGSAANELKGVRNLVFAYTDTFSCTVLSMDFRQARGVTLIGMANIQANGTVAKTQFSSASAALPSSNIRAIGCSLGDVSVNYADGIQIFGDCDNVVITANATNSRIYGKADSVSGATGSNKAYI